MIHIPDSFPDTAHASLYFVGVKGVAMTALAIWAQQQGYSVSGSDVADIFPTDAVLNRHQIKIYPGFDTHHIHDTQPSLVIYTGAHGGRQNVEVQCALEQKIPVIAQGQALGLVTRGKTLISVAGCHGKTTTSAMIAFILQKLSQHPSYAIGCGSINGLDTPGQSDTGSVFVAEADEYATDAKSDLTPRFLWQTPEVLVVTNIDYDHPDVYKNLADITTAYIRFQKQLIGKKITIINADDAPSSVLQSQAIGPIWTFGMGEQAQNQIVHIEMKTGETVVQFTDTDHQSHEFHLHVPGKHNVLNALAAILACRAVDIAWEDIFRALAGFSGTSRRFEDLGMIGSLHCYDDYAHHPSEIRATLAAARAWFPREQILVVFQAHTYSRTKALLSDFGTAFGDADTVLVTDIYASAREHDTLGIDGETLVREIQKHHGDVHFSPNKDTVQVVLDEMKNKSTIVIFMGAGDIYQWGRTIVKTLRTNYE